MHKKKRKIRVLHRCLQAIGLCWVTFNLVGCLNGATEADVDFEVDAFTFPGLTSNELDVTVDVEENSLSCSAKNVTVEYTVVDQANNEVIAVESIDFGKLNGGDAESKDRSYFASTSSTLIITDEDLSYDTDSCSNILGI